MNQFDGKNKPNSNGGYCHNSSDEMPQEKQMTAKPLTGDSYGDNRTDEEIIDEMESGEYDDSDSYERL